MLARCVQAQVVPVASERRMQHHVMYGPAWAANRGAWGIVCDTTLRLRRCEAASKAPRCRARGRRIGREKGPPLLERPEVRGTGKDPLFAGRAGNPPVYHDMTRTRARRAFPSPESDIHCTRVARIRQPRKVGIGYLI